MSDAWVCIDCGNRQPADGRCHACGHDPVLDLADVKVRELMADVERRLAGRRESRFRVLGMLSGMGIIVGLWFVPGYWAARGSLYPGLPVLLDQWLFMALIGLGVQKLLERAFKRRRFPYLRDDLTIA